MEFLLLTTQFKIVFSWVFIFIYCISIHYEQINTITFGDTNAIVNLLKKEIKRNKDTGGEKSSFLYFLQTNLFNRYKKV